MPYVLSPRDLVFKFKPDIGHVNLNIFGGFQKKILFGGYRDFCGYFIGVTSE